MPPIEWNDIEPSPDHDARVRAALRRSQREQRQQKGFELRRQTVLEVAWLLLQEVGLTGFNMRLLGDRAAYTAGALYSYFPGREEVLAALRNKAWVVMGQLVDQVRPAKGARATQPGVPGWWSDSAPPVAWFVQRNLAWWRWLAAREPLCELVLTAPVGAAMPGASQRPGAGSSGLSGPSGISATTQPDALAALAPCLQPLLDASIHSDVAQKLHRQTVTMGLGCLLWRHSEPLVSLEDAWMSAIEPWLRSALQIASLETGGGSGQAAALQPDLFADTDPSRPAVP